MMWNKLTRCGMVVVLAVVFGCTEGKTPPTVKVTGTVTYNGEPVEGASVAFFPETGRGASGLTDSQGRFTLSTFGTNDGAVLGMHKVAITSGGGDEPPPMPGMPGYEESQQGKAPFPAKYGDPKTSGFSAKVEQGGANDFPFDMTDE